MTLPNLDQLKTRLQKVDGYRTTDGKIHSTLEKAVEHENEIDFLKWAENILTDNQVKSLLKDWVPHQRSGRIPGKPRFSVSA